MTAWIVILWRFAASYVRAKHNRAVDAEFQQLDVSVYHKVSFVESESLH